MTPYTRRLRKERIAGRVGDFLSFLSPRIGAPVTPRRIGVFAQWGIGDAVLLLPLLRGLRQAYPNASLDLIGKPFLDDLFQGEDCCDRTHVLVPPWTAHENKYGAPARWNGFARQLRALRRWSFDWLVGTRFDIRETFQMRLLRADETFGFRASGGRDWITRDYGLSRATIDRGHRAELSAKMLDSIIGGYARVEIAFRRNLILQNEMRQWLAAHGYRDGPLLAVHSGAGNQIRRWPDAHFKTVVGALKITPAMIVYIDQSTVVPRLGVAQAHWRGSLTQLKALLSLCDVFLGTDSGVMHIAAAAGCKVVTPFGPTEPRWFSPAGKGHEIVFRQPMPCRPCSDVCIYDSPRCFEGLEPRLVVALERQLLLVAQA